MFNPIFRRQLSYPGTMLVALARRRKKLPLPILILFRRLPACARCGLLAYLQSSWFGWLDLISTRKPVACALYPTGCARPQSGGGAAGGNNV